MIKKSEYLRVFLYHGVKNPSNVQKILDNGFDLTQGNASYINGYGVACFNSPEAVKRHFENLEIPILQILFEGNLIDSWDAEDVIKKKLKEVHYRLSPRDFNETLIENGIDGIVTPSHFPKTKEITIYNLEKIKKIKIFV